MSNDFVEIHNPTTGDTIVVDDHSAYHFNNGYTQFVRYVSNSKVDIFEQDALREEQRLIELAQSADDNLEDVDYGSDTGGDGEAYRYVAVEIY